MVKSVLYRNENDPDLIVRYDNDHETFALEIGDVGFTFQTLDEIQNFCDKVKSIADELFGTQ